MERIIFIKLNIGICGKIIDKSSINKILANYKAGDIIPFSIIKYEAERNIYVVDLKTTNFSLNENAKSYIPNNITSYLALKKITDDIKITRFSRGAVPKNDNNTNNNNSNTYIGNGIKPLFRRGNELSNNNSELKSEETNNSIIKQITKLSLNNANTFQFKPIEKNK